MRLEGKTAIVTGGGQGIGRAIAVAFAREGAAVWIPDLFLERAKTTAAIIKDNGGVAYANQCDVAQEESVKKMIDRAVAQLGRIDILVNNAGIELLKGVEEITVEEWDQVMATNIRGVFLCSKHAIPHMKKAGKGNIINMGSSAGYMGAPFQTVYCASKGAVHQFTKALALELMASNIKVNAIAPGGVATSMLDYLDEEFGKKGIDIKSFIDQQFGGVAQPEDIAAMAVFLASDESRVVHGAALQIDGGLTAA
ncbi:MAG: 3-oxoacyl-ACP reductase FabG [Acidobacteria bacterium]|nr:3-oxoacyl-ACP reductase FabG [Acidobacteriota bacterium]